MNPGQIPFGSPNINFVPTNPEEFHSLNSNVETMITDNAPVQMPKPSPGLVSILKIKIRDSFEGYFSDEQIKATLAQVKCSSFEDGWVPIAMLASFKRIKNISNDLELILSALKESTILEVSQDQLKVRRRVPFKGFIKADKDENTIYANGFSKTTTIEEMKNYFAQFGTVRSAVLIRPPDDPKYKGAVFIEFSSIEETSSVLNAQHIHDGRQINVSLKRIQPTKQIKAKKKSKSKSNLNRVIYFSGVDPSITHSTIKESFSKFAEVAFVDYRRDETTGHIRLKKPLARQTVEKLQQVGFSIGTESVQLKALTEAEEKIYWSVVKEFEPLPNPNHSRNVQRMKPPRGGSHVARGSGHKKHTNRQNSSHPYNRQNKRVDNIRKMMENMHFSSVQS